MSSAGYHKHNLELCLQPHAYVDKVKIVVYTPINNSTIMNYPIDDFILRLAVRGTLVFM